MNERVVALLHAAEAELEACLRGECAAIYRNDPSFMLALDEVQTVNRLLEEELTS